MQLAPRIHLVGSGANGFDLSDPYDCHVYLLDGGDELALIDVGAGLGAEQVIVNVRAAGFDPAAIRRILCTHAHGDHAGGAAKMRHLAPNAALALSPYAADLIRRGDEAGTSLAAAKKVGIYPSDYVLEPCPVDQELTDGDTVQIGEIVLECIETPGHADGHLSFLLDDDGARSLFAGDVLFHGGKVLLQNTHDCRVDALSASLRRLRPLRIDGFYPGHWGFSLRNGSRHIERANAVLDQLLVPEQAIAAW